jgi:NADH-quinone oxidoreductase subunit I
VVEMMIGRFFRAIGAFFGYIWAFIRGLSVTLTEFFHKPITVQYPDVKRVPSARWRGIHYFDKDISGETTCVACGLCVAVCPSACIRLEIAEREDGSRYPAEYEIDELRCVFCGYCQEACPVNAIRLGAGYEYVKYSRKEFALTKERLLSMYEGKK